MSQFQSKTPAPAMDDNGKPILDINGNQMYRPSDVSPSFFVDLGLKALVDPVPGTSLLGLRDFRQGGRYDVQRVGPNKDHVELFEDFANVAIGLYAAAAVFLSP